MSAVRKSAELRNPSPWIRAAAGATSALGVFCLSYHLLFYSFWRALFGEEVWPWPQWSLWLLVVLPGSVALASCVFLFFAKFTKRNLWIAGGITALSLFGLVRYGTEVWKCLFQLGFKP